MSPTLIALTLLRHGRSRADDEGVYEGRYDSPLTAVGEAQAYRRAREWKETGFTFDRVIASTLQRARRTAEIVCEVLNLPLEVSDLWMETNTGGLAGLTPQEAERLYPRPAFRNPYESITPTGESEWQVFLRAAGALEEVIRRGAPRTLVVAHGGILSMTLRAICGVPPWGNRQGVAFHFGDLGFARTAYDPQANVWHFFELRHGLDEPSS
ncbi:MULTISPECIES: histidine phosphatase family protein [Anaerolinea]|uniref:histidine phosphatase family protein n=1 Tax=Anaerolinea TaxID=233189 RepID=UPI00262CF5C5|nr:histidine phosphatase family protein [Anaerolinea thermophila]